MTQSSASKRAQIVRPEFLPFENKLIQSGYVNAEQLKKALVDSRTNNMSLLEVLESLTGKSLPVELQQLYRKKKLFELKVIYGIDAVDIESTTLSKSEIYRLIELFVEIDVCRQLKILPIDITDDNPPVLTVAMIRPANLQTKNEIHKILRPHGIAWRSQVITPEDYQQLLDGYPDKQKQEDAGGTLYEQAVSYHNQGLYDRAEPLYKCALEIEEKALGKEHLNVANILFNLALVYKNQKLYDRAEPLYKRTLEIEEKALGKEHLNVAITLESLANIYKNQKLYDRAEPLYKRALEIEEKALGKEHLNVAITLEKLALIYHNQNLYNHAEPLYKRALEIRQKALGQEHPEIANILQSLAVLYHDQELYDRAEPLYERALEIREKALGDEHPGVAINLQFLAVFYREQRLYDRAEPLYERVLEIREKALGKEHLYVANTLQDLALIYKEQRLYDRAEPLYERALEIREKALGKEHPDVASILQYLAVLYYEQGLYERAEPLYECALEIREKALGDEHPDVANILQDLASIYKKQGLYTRAKFFLKLTLLMREKVLGTEHLDVAFTLYNLADIYQEQKLYARAELLYRRALEIREKLLGHEHLDVALTLDKLAELYRKQGLYEQSKPLYERVLAIREKALGKEHLDLASTLNELAFLAQQQGLFTHAEPLYRRALAIQEKALGQEHSDTAKTLHGLAGLYQRQGLYDRAEPLYRQALQISKTALGTEQHPDIAAIFHGWAGLYKEQGLYERAEPLYERALEISKKTLGEEHPHVAATLHHLAGLYHAQGLYERAEPLYQEDLEISKKTLGDDHIDVATTLHHLADLYQVQGLPERAEPFYQQALEIREKALGKKHPDVAATLNGLAGLYQARGAYNEAEPRYKRALEIQETILGKKHPDVANTLNSLAGLYRVQGLSSSEHTYKRALGIKEAALGQEHPSVATTLHHLAGLYREQERYDLALAQFQAALESQYNFIRKRLAHISEREHKLYLKDLKRTLKALLSLVCRHLNTDQNAIAIALNAVLLTKNLSAAALAARNAIVHSGNPQLQTKIQQIRELIAQSNHLAHDDPQQIQIREQMRALEIQIARIAPEVMLPDTREIDRKAITQKLTLDSTLVEFIGFDLDNSTRYLAFVYSPGRSNEIRLIDLGLASEIDPLIASCRRSILDIYHKLVKTAKVEIADEIEEFPIENLEPVTARIIEPLQLDRVAHVIIAPDGALSFLPFQLFMPDSLVSYLNTGRDLVTKPSQKPVGDSIVIADPDFVNQPTELHLVPSKPQIESELFLAAGIKDLDDWKPLTSFGTLGTAIAAKLRVTCHQQQFATKARLTQSQCPHILSILTHGFALPKTDVEELDPMARSGLAFAGANHGTEYLLLANEVATLDLHNNELTLLVACQTALGDVTTGEGIYGLRRAFALAGAKTLIATLWEIPVYASVILIERFLDNLERFMGKAAALKEAQMYLRDIDVATLDRIPNGAGIDALTELHGTNHDLDDSFQPFSHPYFWAAWICQGDTGAMKYVIAKDLGKFTVSGKVINLRIQK